MTETRTVRRLAPGPLDISRLADNAREVADLTGRALLFLGLTAGLFLAFLRLLGSV